MARPNPSNDRKPFGVEVPAYLGILGAVVVALAGFAIVVFLKSAWRNPAPMGKKLDPSVVIGTFITLYGFFIAGFGVLVGFIAKRGKKQGRWEFLRVMTIALLVEGAGLDLWRVLNSTGDLSTAATSSGPSYRAFNDAIYDFKVYFFINIFVVAFSIATVSLLSAEPLVIQPAKHNAVCRPSGGD